VTIKNYERRFGYSGKLNTIEYGTWHMNTLRNFVVIFFLGIVVFLAGVMVGKSMRGNVRNPVTSAANTVVSIPSQVVSVAPSTQNSNPKEMPKPSVDEALPLPLPLSSSESNSAAEEGHKGHEELSGNETAKPDEEIKYTFYESLTNKKTKTAPVNDIPVVEKPLNKKKPATVAKQTDKTESRGMEKLVLQVVSYPHEGKARLFRNALMREGYGKAVVAAVKIPGKGTWYRVLIVDIKDKQTAKLLQERLQKQKSIRSFITK
jgi:cell division protein FtsN